MKFRLFAFAMFFFMLGQAIVMAQDCAYEVNEFDKFTKEKTLLTKSKLLWKNMGTGNSLSYKAHLKKGNRSLVFKYSDPKSFTLSQGGDFMLLFADGNFITLHYDNEAVAVKDAVEPRYTASFTCSLTDELIKTLTSQTITDFRIVATEGNFDHPITAENAKIFVSQIGCLK